MGKLFFWIIIVAIICASAFLILAQKDPDAANNFVNWLTGNPHRH